MRLTVSLVIGDIFFRWDSAGGFIGLGLSLFVLLVKVEHLKVGLSLLSEKTAKFLGENA